VYPDRQEDMVEEQLARLVRMAERRQHRHPEAGNRSVVDGHGLVVQIADSRRVGVARLTVLA
jgi:hypothetical protein